MGEFEVTTHKAAFVSLVTTMDAPSDRALTRSNCLEQYGTAEEFPLLGARQPPLKKDLISSIEQSESQQQFVSHALRVRSQRHVPKSWFKLVIEGFCVVETES
jgi:hypothetical protein